MIGNEHLKCAPELRRYVLVNTFSNAKHLVTMEMLKEAFSEDDKERDKIISGRSNAWFLYEYFDGDEL